MKAGKARVKGRKRDREKKKNDSRDLKDDEKSEIRNRQEKGLNQINLAAEGNSSSLNGRVITMPKLPVYYSSGRNPLMINTTIDK